MRHDVPYGSRRYSFELPEGRFVRRLVPNTPSTFRPAAEIIAECLRNPLGSRPLRELAEGRKTAAILIPGKARRVGTQEYVPALIAELEAGGIPSSGIEIVLADGTHEQHLADDMVDLLGKELVSRVRCVGHDARNVEGEHTRLGTTSRGTPVWFSTRVVEADLKILTGRIVPHYFAGFSGGRKALLPGVAAFPTIVANHRRTLDPEQGIHPEVRVCSLEKNPIHLDMLEAARMAKPDFCLNTLLDAEHNMIEAYAGDFEAVHEESCRRAEPMFKIVMEEPVDVLITSAGGLPYDCNFMQALKAVFNFKDVIRPGGSILWIAECEGGMNPGFLDWAAYESDSEMESAIRDKYVLTGHNSLMLRQLIRKANVAMWSALPPESVSRIGIRPVTTLDAGLEWIRGKAPKNFTYAVAPYANAICATLG